MVQHFALHIPAVISSPTLCITYFHCYQWTNTVCYIFPLLSAIQHGVLHIPTVISGPTLCVTGFHCCQRFSTLCYRFKFTVISGPTLCATSLHCHQRAVNDDIASKTFGLFFFPLYTPSQTIRLVSSHFLSLSASSCSQPFL